MKKINALERASLLFVVILVFLSTYCVVYGGELTTINNGPTTGGDLCSLAPRITTPNLDGTIPVLGEVYFELYAPCSIGAHVSIVNLNGPQPSVVNFSGMTDSASVIRTNSMSVTSFYNGRYAVKVTVGYPGVNGVPNNRYIGMDTTNQKFFDIKSGIPTTVTPPVDTTPTTTNTTTTTPPVTSTGGSSTSNSTATSANTTNTITVPDGTTLSGSALQGYTAQKLTETVQVTLPTEVAAAPVSTTILTEKANITMTDKSKGKVVLSGKGEPNTELTLYIYSEPIVVTVRTDANGDWSYALDQELAAGKHEVYVAVKKNDGTIAAKSQPFSFFVGTAQAASVSDAAVTSATPEQKNYLIYYITLAASFIAIMITVIFYLVTKSHLRKQDAATKV